MKPTGSPYAGTGDGNLMQNFNETVTNSYRVTKINCSNWSNPEVKLK